MGTEAITRHGNLGLLAVLGVLVRRKWIADPNSSKHLPVVQILSPQRVASGFRPRREFADSVGGLVN
jgi:hypothetical protein